MLELARMDKKVFLTSPQNYSILFYFSFVNFLHSIFYLFTVIYSVFRVVLFACYFQSILGRW